MDTFDNRVRTIKQETQSLLRVVGRLNLYAQQIHNMDRQRLNSEVEKIKHIILNMDKIINNEPHTDSEWDKFKGQAADLQNPFGQI